MFEVLNIIKNQKFDRENKENLIFKKIFLKTWKIILFLKKFHGKNIDFNVEKNF